jgi:hypothetical protein
MRRRCAALLCVLLLAPADVAAEGAVTLLERGITAFGLGQLEASRQVLRQAREATRDPRLLAKIQLYLGLNDAVEGAEEKARRAFSAALRHDPTLVLDRRNFKPDLVRLFNDVRQRMSGRLAISIAAPGVKVLIDGEERGTAPLDASIPPGRHIVEVQTADGLSTYRAEVVVVPGHQTRVEALLERRKGRLLLRSEPAGAEVLVDGVPVGEAPLNRLVEAGPHVVVMRYMGRAAQLQRVTVRPEQDTRVSLTLAPLSPGEAPAARPNWFNRRLWTWVAAGTALAALGTGIGFGISAEVDFNEHEATCADQYHGRCDELAHRIESKDRVANVMFGMAAAAAAAAVVLYFVEDRAPAATEAAGLRPLAGGAGGLLSVRF